MLATLQGSPMANSKSLKDKAQGKYLICRQVRHWVEEGPNHDKSPKTACYKYQQLGHWVALCPWDDRASRSSDKPSLMMVQQDWSSPLQPACLSKITIMELEPRVQLDVAGRSKNFLVDTGATYSVLSSFSRVFSSQTCTILGAMGKSIMKRFTQALLCCWNGQILCHQVLVVPACPIPLLGRELSLPSKSCSDCSPDTRCFKTLSWGQTNYFYQPPSEITPEWERPFMDLWSKDPQISSSADGKSRPDCIPLWGS